MSILQQYFAPSANKRQKGIYSVCSAHPLVLRAAAEQATSDSSLLLIEATSNQVNQDGGYTGMRPDDFRIFAERIAMAANLPPDKLILGGDHLGPNPWRHLPAAEAMQHAETMVAAYAAASFTKIHLDASMSCLGDPLVLNDEDVARRSVQLCRAAEAAYVPLSFEAGRPVYVIGTEVPTPGGATHSLGGLVITSPEAAARTLAVHREAFLDSRFENAWTRVIALVVQPGVEFDHDSVIHYEPSKAARLIDWRRHNAASVVFEAHSTDYQLAPAYRQLVEDGFAILKVGPALTFALREALDALAAMERILVDPSQQSHLAEVIEKTMLAQPGAWRSYYAGTEKQQELLRRFSYSDRVRYYWHDPEIGAAVDQLYRNLGNVTVPESMLSLYLPSQYERVRAGLIAGDPRSLVVDKVKDVLRIYAQACQ